MSEPTTVFAKICRGNGLPTLEASTEVVAMGIIRVGTLDLLKQLVTFRADGTDTSRAGVDPYPLRRILFWPAMGCLRAARAAIFVAISESV